MLSEATERHSSTDAVAMREAMCARIRRLGNDILAITRAAVEKVEALDAEHELKLQQQRKLREPPQQQEQKQQQQVQLSTRPNVNTKSIRCSKAAPTAAATPSARLLRRPSLAMRPVIGGKSSAGVSAAPFSSASTAAAAVDSTGSEVGPGRPRLGACTSMSGAAAGRKKGKARINSGNVAAVAASGATSSQPAQSKPLASVSLAETRSGRQVVDAAAEEGGRLNTAHGSVVVHCDPAALAGSGAAIHAASSLAEICQAAENDYNRILNVPLSRQDVSEAHHSAPLYDLSNAAATCIESVRDKGSVAADVKGGGGDAVESGDGAVVDAWELPDNVLCDAAENTCVAGAPAHKASSPISYYCVVYIHQSTRNRKRGEYSPGSGHSSSRGGVLHRRLTPRLNSPAAQEKEAEEAPRMVNSYVSAMYAATTVNESHTTEDHSSAANSAPAIVDPVVQLELRVPTQLRTGSSVHTLTASRASTPSTGAFRFPLLAADASAGGALVSEESRATPPVDATSNETANTDTSAAAAAPAAAVTSSEEADVEAQIQCMEGWRRDRQTSVENRIRQRLQSAVVAPGWQGEYFYYSSPNRVLADPLSSHVSPPAAPETGGEASPDVRPDSAAVSPSNNSIDGRPPIAPTSAVWNASSAYSSGAEEELLPMAQRQLSRPAHPLPSPIGLTSASAASPGTARMTMYDVLLLTRPAASSCLTTPRLSNGGSAVAASPPQGAAMTTNSGAATSADSGAQSARTTTTAATAAASALVAGTSGGSRCRQRPRLEVVVASDYSSMEWTFAGEVRRTSAESNGAAGEKAEAARTTPVIGGGAASPSTPLWTAHQLRELAAEERRRWNARTRQPHGEDIHAPIMLQI